MIQKLKNEFDGTGEVAGFKFLKIDSVGDVFCYKVTSPEGKYHFEIFRAKISPVCIDFEKRIYSDVLFKEVYPKSNSFGISAWTKRTLDEAQLKFEELWN
jgi:hypothetical protein